MDCGGGGQKEESELLLRALSNTVFRGGEKEENPLIKIQLRLTFSLLPFQSFYSFKSLTISVKLKR